MAGLRTAVLLLAVAMTLVAPAAGGGADPSAAQLRALLAGANVPLDRAKTPTVASFPAAWTVFQRFARSGEPNDLFFEFGVFESHYWGTSFEIVLRSGQVHLVVHFPVAAFIAITRDLRATPCIPGAGCTFRCFFTGDDGLVSHGCRVTADGYRVGNMTLTGRRSRAWIAGVESSPIFRALLARHVRPVGYEVWTG